MRGWILPSLVILISVAPAEAQFRKEAIIILKDGFFLTGKVVEPKSYILDPSGQSFTIPLPGSLINLDDMVRRMYFIPGQLQEVLEKKNIDRDLLDLRRYAATSRPDKILPGWQVETFTTFNSQWERSLKVHVTSPNNGYFDMGQRIIQFTPFFMRIQTLKYDWDLFHLTRELEPSEVRGLLAGYLADKKSKDKKDLKVWDKRKLIAMFMHQAGWHEEALKELVSLVEEYPSQKKEVAGLQENIKKVLADIYVEDTERAFKVGQYQDVKDRLAYYAKDAMSSRVNEKNLLLAQDLQNKYDSFKEKTAQTKKLLKALPGLAPVSARAQWTKIADVIQAELNFDALPKLDTFLVFAQQHLRELDAKTKPTQSAEEVLALAVSGWLLGNASAEPDIKSARELWRLREMVLEYQKTINSDQRMQMLASAVRGGTISLDVLARVIKNLPPAFALDKSRINPRIAKLPIDIADSQGGEYFVQLPPEYNPMRPYPVLLLLHGPREKPEAMLARFSELAAQNGFILAAPLWPGSRGKSNYAFSAREHAVVLDSLRDLRRRFQVDSDRVFLFGWEQGAEAAFDIGLGHPDQFAGVLPMCGMPRWYAAEQNRYQTNAQYLPFYIVDGDRDGINPKAIFSVFKYWVRGNYPALYVEYKGRGSEWFQGELPRMFDWMSRKKRHHPSREMGRRDTSGGIGEEFRTMRECDNRFYWLSTDAIQESHLNSPSPELWVRNKQPAILQARISVGNELVGKAGGQKEAKIFTQFNVQAKGVKQLSLWLAPHMVDFTKPIRIMVNGSQFERVQIVQPNPAVMMEDFYYNGDRQRLFFARVDMKF